jgi:hypothetical protein
MTNWCRKTEIEGKLEIERSWTKDTAIRRLLAKKKVRIVR